MKTKLTFLLVVFFFLSVLALGQQKTNNTDSAIKAMNSIIQSDKSDINNLYTPHKFPGHKAVRKEMLPESKIISLRINGQNPAIIPFGAPMLLTFLYSPGQSQAQITIALDLNQNGILDGDDFLWNEYPFDAWDGDVDDQDGSVNGLYSWLLPSDGDDGPPISMLAGMKVLFIVEDGVSSASCTASILPLQSNYAISGTVLYPVNQPNIVIMAMDPISGMSLVTLTDAFGQYSINLPDDMPRVYTVLAADYLEVTSGEILPSAPQAILVNGIITGIDFTFTQATEFIQGQITTGGVPVPGVKVSARLQNGPGMDFEPHAVADAQGNYSLGVYPGQWRVNVDRSSLGGDYLVPQSIDNIVVLPGQTAGNKNFALYPLQGYIEGYVYQESVPKKGVEVYASSDQGHNYGPTKPDGKFRIQIYDNFQYYVGIDSRFIPDGYYLEPPYYQNVNTGATGLNFNIIPSPSAVEGYVRDSATNAALQNMEVVVFNDTYYNSTFTDENGFYHINLNNGDYWVQTGLIELGYIPQAFSFSVFDNTHTQNFSLVHIDPGYIQGSVKAPNMLPLANAVTVGFRVVNGNIIWDPVNYSSTDLSGNYSLPLPPGEYIVFGWAEGFIGEFFDNTQDPQTAQHFFVTENSVTSGINFVLEPSSYIFGQVMDSLGNPVQNAFIAAIDTNGTWQGIYNGNRIRVVTSDESGNYVIDQLPAGIYYVECATPGFEIQYFDHVSDPMLATPVTVDPQNPFFGADFNLITSELFFPWINVKNNQISPSEFHLKFGIFWSATSGIDPLLGESVLDPAGNEFDARFTLPTGEQSRIDIRSEMEPNLLWILNLNGGMENYPLTFTWDPMMLPPGKFFLVDPMGGTTININMKTDSYFELTAPSFPYLMIAYSANQTAQVNVNSGWNMISVPLHSADMSTYSLFPDAASNAFGFDNGYITVSELNLGKGYWLKFNSPGNYQIEGMSEYFPISVNAGWNMIGPFENTVPVNQIVSDPPGIMQTGFYGYDNGYFTTQNLEPGKGYWIKTSSPGLINLGQNVNKTSVNSAAAEEFEGSIRFVDALGYSAALKIASGGSDINRYELPPMPPAGVFDVRFSSNRYAEKLNSGMVKVNISGAAYPVKISADNCSVIIIKGLSGIRTTTDLTNENSVMVENGSDEIWVMQKDIPSDYTLSRNYPNPFNPSTKIRFGLKSESRVKLTIINSIGQEVAGFIDEILNAGNYERTFNAVNLASGIYLCRMEVFDLNSGSLVFFGVNKMLLVK